MLVAAKGNRNAASVPNFDDMPRRNAKANFNSVIANARMKSRCRLWSYSPHISNVRTCSDPLMNSRLLLGVCLMFLLVSCSKKHEAPGPAAAPGAESAPGTATPTPATPGASAAGETGNASAALVPLTQALRKYYFEHRQVPPTFEEFATVARVQVPPAPPGKKFAIERKTLEVVLVDR
jgi:hypothetical protein